MLQVRNVEDFERSPSVLGDDRSSQALERELLVCLSLYLAHDAALEKLRMAHKILREEDYDLSLCARIDHARLVAVYRYALQGLRACIASSWGNDSLVEE